MSHTEVDYVGRIREEGYRLTPQRQIILDALCAIRRHASIAELVERVRAVSPAIDRATVYRTMVFFSELRLVTSAEVDGVTVYEIASSEPHYHLVCRRCGAIAHLPAYHLAGLVEHLAVEHGFVAEIEQLTISGVCSECVGH